MEIGEAGRVARRSLSAFLRAVHDENIPLQKLTGEDRNEGGPRVEVTRPRASYPVVSNSVPSALLIESSKSGQQTYQHHYHARQGQHPQ